MDKEGGNNLVMTEGGTDKDKEGCNDIDLVLTEEGTDRDKEGRKDLMMT